jgi:chromosome partitioning protein
LGINQEAGVFNALVNTRSDIHQWVRETNRTGLSLLPGDRSTATAQIVINAENRPIDSIRQLFKSLGREYDYIIFDTAPSVGGIQERAIHAAEMALLPTATEFLSMDGLAQMMELLKTLREKHQWSGKLAGILPTFYDEQTSESDKSLAEMREGFGESVLPPIHRATVLRECAAEGRTIFEMSPASRSSREYEELSREIVKRS